MTNTKRYFKVVRGFDGEHIPIDDTELEKALYAHITGKVVVFQEGSINGNHISAIMPDYNRAMGYSRGWKMTADDYNALSDAGIEDQYKGYLAEVKDKVNRLIETRQEHLIGKNADVKQLT